MCTDKLFPTRNTAGRNKYLCFHTLASWLARVNKIKTHIRTKYNKWSWDSSLNIIPCWENEHADKIPRRELYWERGEPCIVWWWISILWLLNNNININSLPLVRLVILQPILELWPDKHLVINTLDSNQTKSSQGW